jgi:DNA-binding MarR family transcriptional regulator
MVDEGTTITRLLDKLEEAGLIRRERGYPDRRQVLCFVSDAGLATAVAAAWNVRLGCRPYC